MAAGRKQKIAYLIPSIGEAQRIVIISYVIPAFFVVVIVMAVFWDWWRSKRMFCVPLPRPFRHRDSQRADWRQNYHDDMQDKADALLRIVCDVFGFNPDDRYQFASTDRIKDIYRAYYPRWKFWNIADSLELEGLMSELGKQFGVADEDWHPNITLGELLKSMKSLPTEQSAE